MTLQKYNNILVVRTDRMGDVVLTTPAIEALKVAYPHARITLMVSPSTKDLVSENPFLDELIIDDRKKKYKGLKGFIKLIHFLRQKKFDLAIIYHTKRRFNLACFLAGIPNRVGYKNDKLGILLTNPIKDTRHEGKKHESQYCLDVLEILGITTREGKLHVSTTKESDLWMEEYLRQNQIADKDFLIGVHPGASDPSRHWPAHRFNELIDILIEKYQCKVIILGGPDVVSVSSTIKSSLRNSAFVYDVTGKTSLHQFGSVLKRCNLFISNDSGPVHVAAAVGTPVVAIFTRNQPGINPERWRPLSRNSKVVSVSPEQSNLSFKKSGKAPAQYLDLISTETVLEAVDAIYKLC
ncbi:MAG: lipopolysaccharide heptosyltransferase II [Candidatus Omnitrophica bacterium]|nr:lipopolysaccharide heptosyltransferase II [Candidatus Omnitrophota bacterium]